MSDSNRRSPLEVAAIASTLGALLVGCFAACGGSPTQAVVASPTPDSATRAYVALVHSYWMEYKTAEGDLVDVSGTYSGPFSSQDAARACFGLPSTTMPQDIGLVDPQICGQLSAAMLAVHEKFLSDLNSTPAPQKFAADDQVFRSQLPQAIAFMNTMISAAATGSKQSVFDATALYVQAMVPKVTDALDHVDPSLLHN
jgi:hypothetical protein